MHKGRRTKQAILIEGLDIASELGIEGLTIGLLAKRVGMSKSGLYAHFDSKEQLQCAVIDMSAKAFVDAVISPAIKHPRGLPRIRAMFELWESWSTSAFTGGCPFIAGATELDDRPGPVRDTLVGHLNDLLGSVERAATIAIEEGHFRADLDLKQFSYEFWANMVAYHHHARLFRDADAPLRARRMAQQQFDHACVVN